MNKELIERAEKEGVYVNTFGGLVYCPEVYHIVYNDTLKAWSEADQDYTLKEDTYLSSWAFKPEDFKYIGWDRKIFKHLL